MQGAQWQVAPNLVEANGTLPWDNEQGETRDYFTLELTVPMAGDGWTATVAFLVPDGFKGFRPKAVSVLQAVKSWTKTSTNLDLFAKIKQQDGTVLDTVTVTYSASENASELTEFAFSANALAGKFRPGDALVIEVGTPDSGNTGESSADWTSVIGKVCVNWK